jgi:hypothetical protein
MTDTVLILNATIAAPDVITTLFTAATSGQGAIVTAFTASNNSGASASYKAYIYDQTGSLVAAVVPMKIVVRDRFDTAPSMVNQVVPAGGSIRVENSTGDALSFYASGREQ